MKALGKKYDFSLSTPIEKLSRDHLDIILNGSTEMITVAVEYNKWNVQSYQVSFDGIIRMLEEQQERRGDEGMDDMENYRVLRTCPVCEGARLKKESLHFKVDRKNIFELACMDISTLQECCTGLEDRLY